MRVKGYGFLTGLRFRNSMPAMRNLIALLLSLLLFFSVLYAITRIPKPRRAGSAPTSSIEHSSTLRMLKKKAPEARRYASQHQLNEDQAFLIDMAEESGRNRFFVYSLKGDSILAAGLVTHGRCNQVWLTGRKYGNEVGCGCTSLGKYKVGASYQGRFGLAFKLHGLESTNSNAFKRYVVLHSHTCVAEKEIAPLPLCQSDGCPTVSPGFLEYLSEKIGASGKPILLWIYDSGQL